MDPSSGLGFVTTGPSQQAEKDSRASSIRGHRCKQGKPSMPFWCGLLTRVIKAGTDEFKSAPCTQAQVDERVKLESQG
eukprot:12607269-Heterocapsa_arctica.AAC.1